MSDIAKIELEFFICREFLDMVRRSLEGNRDAVVYFEGPNAFLVFRDLSIWDVVNEHCNYFAGATLDSLFRRREIVSNVVERARRAVTR